MGSLTCNFTSITRPSRHFCHLNFHRDILKLVWRSFKDDISKDEKFILNKTSISSCRKIAKTQSDMFERACTAVWHYSLVPLRWFKEPSAEALMVGLEELSLSPVFKPWINPVFMKKSQHGEVSTLSADACFSPPCYTSDCWIIGP